MTVIITPSGQKAVPSRRLDVGRTTRIASDGGRVSLLGRTYSAATYEGMYRSQPWLYVAVNKLMKAIARLPLKSYRYLDSAGEEVERVRDHPLINLLNRPWAGAGAYHLKEAAVGSLAIHGNALFMKIRREGAAPSELWFLPWRHIQVDLHNHGITQFYFVPPYGGEKLVLTPDDVVHFRHWGLGGPLGVSPIEPLRKTLALEDAAVGYAAGNFKNSATPRAVFSTDKKLAEGSPDRLRVELDRLYGGPENAGRFAILDQGLSVEALQHSVVDTDLIKQRQLNREEVAAAYDLSPPLVGILDRATFNNISELHLALYTDSLPPWLDLIETTIHTQLRDPEPTFRGVFTEFDLRDVLKGDIEKRSAAYQRFLQSAVYSPNELRRLENLPPIGDPSDQDNPANQVLVPLNMVPIGASDEQIEARSRANVAVPTIAPSANGHHDKPPVLDSVTQ